MSVVCAWCHEVLSEDQAGPVTHGICRNCAADLQFMPQSFDRFLDTLPGPVLAVDEDCRVLGVNVAASAMVRLEPGEMRDRLSGEVLSCVYSELPGGCGRTMHCSGCAIRQGVTHTWTTGEAIKDKPAFSHRHGPDGPVQMSYLVSTERMGPLVLVQIEEAEVDGLTLNCPPA
jgi:hypothetical protein